MISSYDYEDSLAEAKFLYDLCVKDDNHREVLTNLVVISLVTSIEVFAERIWGRLWTSRYCDFDGYLFCR